MAATFRSVYVLLLFCGAGCLVGRTPPLSGDDRGVAADGDKDVVGDASGDGSVGDSGGDGSAGDSGGDGSVGDSGGDGSAGDSGGDGSVGDPGGDGSVGDPGGDIALGDPVLVNQPPVAGDDSAAVVIGGQVIIEPLANDFDPDADPLQLQSFTQPSAGTVSDNGNGTLTYNPSLSFSGTDTFTYVVSDGRGGTNVGTVTVTVTAVAAGARIAAGDAHSCARSYVGKLKCWGGNTNGQLGQGSDSDRGNAPSEMGAGMPLLNLGTGRIPSKLASGSFHTCALLDAGEVKCWGDNGRGQLGVGDTRRRADGAGEMGDALLVVDLGVGVTATAIDAGDNSTCARLTSGDLKCWGGAGNGRLGLGSTSSMGDNPGEMGDALLAVNLGTARTAKAVSVGYAHACAILDDDSVKCSGDGSSGRLGLGDVADRGTNAAQMGDNLLPVNLGTMRTAVAISAGGHHTCAILDDLSLRCWGRNGFGELGQGDSINRGSAGGQMGDLLLPVQLGAGRTVQAVSTGHCHTCALLDDATVKCWGLNSRGQLGNGQLGGTVGEAVSDMGDNLFAIDLGVGNTAVAVTAAGYGTCVRLQDQTVKCWGDNASGQLGQGDTARRGDGPGQMGDLLLPVSLPTTAIALSGGFDHNCALLTGNSVVCWGDNDRGQLGRDFNSAHLSDEPSEVETGIPFVDLGTGHFAMSIAAGEAHSCAIIEDGSVKCWGRNLFGALGLGDLISRGYRPGQMGDALSAVDLGTGRLATSIDAGIGHSCAILDDATLRCWGLNDGGQLGLADTANRGDGVGLMGTQLNPVLLGTSRTAIAVATGGNHTCAILDDTSTKCWGRNFYGQLGLGHQNSQGADAFGTGDNLVALSFGSGVGGLLSATTIAAGNNHTCATLSNGMLKCWGANDFGKLGQGDLSRRGDGAGEMGDNLLPVQLGTGLTAVVVGAGDDHTCALLDDGSVKCWGRGGLLGLGDSFDRGSQGGQMGDLLAPVDLGPGRRATELAVGGKHTCALLDDDTIKCWGENGVGQLGLGDNEVRGAGSGQMGLDLPPLPLSLVDWSAWDGTSDGLPTVLNGSGDWNYCSGILPLDANHILVITCTGYTATQVLVGTVAGNGISFGAPVAFSRARSIQLLRLSTDRVLATYSGGGSTGDAVVITVDANYAVSIGAPFTFEADRSGDIGAALLTPSKALVAYRNSDNVVTTYQGTMRVLDIVGDVITTGARVEIYPGDAAWTFRWARLSSTQALLAIRTGTGSPARGRAVVVDVTGTAITVTSANNDFRVPNDVAFLTAFGVGSRKTLLLYRDGWFDYNLGRMQAVILGFDGSTLSAGTTQQLTTQDIFRIGAAQMSRHQILTFFRDQDDGDLGKVMLLRLQEPNVLPNAIVTISSPTPVHEASLHRLDDHRAIAIYRDAITAFDHAKVLVSP